jgi:hypothetical protein
MAGIKINVNYALRMILLWRKRTLDAFAGRILNGNYQRGV